MNSTSLSGAKAQWAKDLGQIVAEANEDKAAMVLEKST